MNNFPTVTQCGSCHQRVPLKIRNWKQCRTSKNELAGFTQVAECQHCGSTLYAILGSSLMLSEVQNLNV